MCLTLDFSTDPHRSEMIRYRLKDCDEDSEYQGQRQSQRV